MDEQQNKKTKSETEKKLISAGIGHSIPGASPFINGFNQSIKPQISAGNLLNRKNFPKNNFKYNSPGDSDLQQNSESNKLQDESSISENKNQQNLQGMPHNVTSDLSNENELNNQQDKPRTIKERLKSFLFNKKDKDGKNTAKGAVDLDVTAKLKKQITGYIWKSSFSTIAAFSVFLIVALAMVVLAPLIYINSLKDSVDSTVEKLGNFLTFQGWCTDEECKNKDEENFYEELDKIVDEYSEKYGVKLNKNLITATLTYSNPFVGKEDVNQQDEDVPQDFEDLFDESTNAVDFKKSKNKIKLLARHMIKGCIYENGEEIECKNGDVSTNAPSNFSKKTVLDEEGYRKYLEDEFIRKYYFNGATGDEIDNQIISAVRSIFAKAKMFEKEESYEIISNISALCPGVAVDTNGKIETYPLEYYVAGVVRHESGTGVKAWTEEYKAQAIIARTYALMRTKKCTVPIKNGQMAQAFTPSDANDSAKEAAEATEGKVLTYKGEMFYTEYDSYCYKDKDCEYGKENGKYYVVYSRLPNKEQHKVYLTDKYIHRTAGGHGRGLSQWAAFEMSENGSDYEEILKFFYSPGVEIRKISSESFIEPPKDKNELLERSIHYASIGYVKMGTGKIDLSLIYPSNAKNLGQCVWYARSRALELIYHSNMNEETKLKAFNIISRARGDGRSWYDSVTSSPEYNDFFRKSQIPIPISIVSWSSNTAWGARHNHGHVAIVESVDNENNNITISEGWNAKGAGGASIWTNVRIGHKTLSNYQMNNRPGYSGYRLNGYVSLLNNKGA